MGGVVGGVAALVILALLLWFFVFRKKRRSAAFDEKTFDPGNRHSVHDPIDLLAPAVPNVGSPTSGTGPGVNSPRVDPFPYGGAAAGAAAGVAAAHHPGSPEQQPYGPYAQNPHPSMQFPDARNYMVGGGNGGYGYGGATDGGYGAAAGGAAADGYGEGEYDQRYAPSQSASSNYSHPSQALSPRGAGAGGQNVPPVPPLAGSAGMSAAALAKQREATVERERLRQSAGFQGSPVAGAGPAAAAGGSAAGGSGVAVDPRSSIHSEGRQEDDARGVVEWSVSTYGLW